MREQVSCGKGNLMSKGQLDRFQLNLRPLSERPVNKVQIERDKVLPGTSPENLSPGAVYVIEETVERIREAKAAGKPVMLACGAHTIKNGMSPVLIALMERGVISHIAMNGAGIIHDWEFAYQSMTSENVEENTAQGLFGNWQETGYYINLAINVGAYEGKGYGESLGAMIENEGLEIPSQEKIMKDIGNAQDDPEKAAAAADLLWAVKKFDIPAGFLSVPHPFKQYSVQAAAWRLGVRSTGHPMIGHDIIYNHPMNHCAAIGRCAERDFLTFADNVSRLDGGVYMSVGSAVMSPMIFEKSLSMSQNLCLQKGEHIDNHFMVVVDLAESHWDWSKGEPPEDNPDYYLRYCKSFSRMGGQMRYVSADNRDFLLAILKGM